MISIFTFTARSLRRTLDNIATPCSVKAYGRVRLPPHKLEITNCDLKISNSDRLAWLGDHQNVLRNKRSRIQSAVVYWQRFDPAEFEYEFDEEELAAHGITVDEAAEVFWNGFEVRRNKREGTGYQIIGQSDAGRSLKLIAYEKRKRLIRVITGWPI